MIKRILILLIILSTIIGCSTDEPIINPISPKTTSLNRIYTNKNINLENIRVNNRKAKRIIDVENTIDVSEIDESIPDETEDIPEPIQESNPYEDMVLIPDGDFYRGHISYKKIEIESGWDEWGTYRTTVTEKVIPEQWELTYTDAFYIDSAEVTRRDYRKFCEATGRVMPPPLTRDEWDRPIPKEFQDGYPITHITWQDAKDYAEWIGKRLPTSAEWEKAARGGLVKKPYVWGDICIKPNSWIAAGNFRLGGRTSSANAWSYLGVGLKPTKKPNEFKFRQNEYGITDMSGNVTEFVSDGYDDNGHFTMGASFATGYGYFGTAKGNRFYDGIIIGQRKYYKPEDIHINTGSIGFRCVKDVE